MAELTSEQLIELYDQISLNSVSNSTLVGENEYNHDFTGNDLYFAHTTGEVNRKANTTIAPELNDAEIIALQAADEEAFEAGATEGGEETTPEEPGNNGNTEGGENTTPGTDNGTTEGGENTTPEETGNGNTEGGGDTTTNP